MHLQQKSEFLPSFAPQPNLSGSRGRCTQSFTWAVERTRPAGGAQGRSVSDYPAYVFRLTARDMARFALPYLRKGRWKDAQVVPKAWVERTTKTDRLAGDFGGHEFFWWDFGWEGSLPGSGYR